MQPVSLTLPTTARAAAQALTAARAALRDQIAQTLADLEEFEGAETEAGGAAEFADDAALAAAVAQTAKQTVLQYDFTQYTFGLKEPGTAGFYLSQRRAVNAVINKLTDPAETRGVDLLQGELGCCVLLLSQPTLEAFIEALDIFNRAWPISSWQSAARRTRAELAREREKYIIPQAPRWPRPKVLKANQIGGLRGVAKQMGRLAADTQAAAADNPAELLNMLTVKQAALAAMDALLDADDTGVAGARVALVQAAELGQLTGQLAALDAGFELTHTAACAWVGPVAAVRLIAERLGWQDPDDEQESEGDN